MAAQDRTKAQRRQESRRVLARMKEVIPSILAQHPVDAAYAFGSAARGTMTPFSDVDIALLLTSPVPPYERLKLELAIQGEIETASGLFPVDVRAINSAPLMVKGRIVQQGPECVNDFETLCGLNLVSNLTAPALWICGQLQKDAVDHIPTATTTTICHSSLVG